MYQSGLTIPPASSSMIQHKPEKSSQSSVVLSSPVCLKGDNDFSGIVAGLMATFKKDLSLEKRDEFIHKMTAKLVPGSSIKSLSAVLKYVMFKETGGAIDKARVKSADYAQRWSSGESWGEWMERRTALGRIVDSFNNFQEASPGDAARSLAHFDIAMIEEANDQASSAIVNLIDEMNERAQNPLDDFENHPPAPTTALAAMRSSLSHLVSRVDQLMSFPGALAVTISASKKESKASSLNEILVSFLVGESEENPPLVHEVSEEVFSYKGRDLKSGIPNFAVITERLQQRLKAFEAGFSLIEAYQRFIPETSGEKEMVEKVNKLIKDENNFIKLIEDTQITYLEISLRVSEYLRVKRRELASLAKQKESDSQSLRVEMDIKHKLYILNQYNSETFELETEKRESQERRRLLEELEQKSTTLTSWLRILDTHASWPRILETMANKASIFKSKMDRLKLGIEYIATNVTVGNDSELQEKISSEL